MDTDIQESAEKKDPIEMPPAEKQARERGWRPKEEWDGEGEWYDYNEFNRRGELLDKISEQSKAQKKLQKKLTDFERVVSDLVEHNKQITKKEYDSSMQRLRAQKADALLNQDVDLVVELDEKIAELKDAQRRTEEAPKQAPQAEGPNPHFIAFVNENPWYIEDPLLQGAADKVAELYMREHPDFQEDPQSMFAHVSKEIRRRFRVTKEDRPSRAAGADAGTRSQGSSGSSGKRKWTVNQLNQQQRSIAERFARTGIMSIEEYVQQLGEAGEIS